MVKSMTGYGRGEVQSDNLNVIVEIKAVNHRFFEFNAKVPRSCIYLEDTLKKFVAGKISRGKVDCFVTLEFATGDETTVKINESYAKSYVDALKKLSAEFGLADDISVSTVARNGDVFSITKSQIDEDVVIATVLEAAEKAVEAFIEMRKTEGEKMYADVQNRVAFIKDTVSFIEERSPKTVVEYREKLEQKIRELLDDKDVDEQRLLTETAVFADKIAVAEETVRLRSHMDQMLSLIDMEEPVGRKLDFLIQEMNRETNTIGSKAQDIEITRKVVDMKSEIEKIREQIQNIE